jgi:biotin carboxyl carrier protein
MKMEHSIVAVANGKVKKFRAKPGDWVEEASLLVDFNTDS